MAKNEIKIERQKQRRMRRRIRAREAGKATKFNHNFNNIWGIFHH